MHLAEHCRLAVHFQGALQAQAPVLTTLSSALLSGLAINLCLMSSIPHYIILPHPRSLDRVSSQSRDAPASFWISLCLLLASRESHFSLHFWLKYLICIKTLII